MNDALKSAVATQFSASISMLENAIRACPDAVWSDRGREPQFWYLAYHTLFWLDLYLGGAVEGFAPPAPFTLSELDPDGRLPERAYSKDELLVYLDHCRAKCRATVGALSDRTAAAMHRFRWGEVNTLGLLLYNLRHVQHGAAQLNLVLRQTTDSAPRWVTSAEP